MSTKKRSDCVIQQLPKQLRNLHLLEKIVTFVVLCIKRDNILVIQQGPIFKDWCLKLISRTTFTWKKISEPAISFDDII